VHLSDCEECREAFAQYQSVATDGMSYLAEQYGVPPKSISFDETAALTRLMQATEVPHTQGLPMSSRKVKSHSWKPALVSGLAAASLLIGVATASYWMGQHSKNQRAQNANPGPSPVLVQLTAQKQTLEKVIQADNQQITALEQRAASDQEETDKLRSQADSSAANLAALTAELADQKKQSDAQIAALVQDRDSTAARLHDAEKVYQTVQDQLNTLRNQHQQDLLRMASLDDRVNTLTASLSDQNTRVKGDEQYLSSDKDIRDLIGARNLYIADIMDVDEAGQSRKPFGRVFYTKTKSLIFYAYDLDRQPGVRRTSTFQVWGRTGPSDGKPVSLGILYMDSETNRRWTLKVDDPRQLAQLDAIFVTIEPRPQAEKPTGKPFLFASLRRDPNHP
jgi:hypothetical protein